MAIARRRIVPGDRRIAEANKIADSIDMRIVGLRNSLAKIGAEHNTFLARAQKEQADINASLKKSKEELAQLTSKISVAKAKDAKERKAWTEEKVALKTELTQKLKEAELYKNIQKTKADEATKHAVDLNSRVLNANINLASREQEVKIREDKCSAQEKKQASTAKEQAVRAEKLSASETNYRARVTLLALNEKTASDILAREHAVRRNEARLDVKAKLVQETGKKQAIDKAFIAREKARLNRVRHLQKEGVVK